MDGDMLVLGQITLAQAEADARLGNETSTTTGLNRAEGTVTWTNGTGATAASVQVSNTFTMTKWQHTYNH